MPTGSQTDEFSLLHRYILDSSGMLSAVIHMVGKQALPQNSWVKAMISLRRVESLWPHALPKYLPLTLSSCVLSFNMWILGDTKFQPTKIAQLGVMSRHVGSRAQFLAIILCTDLYEGSIFCNPEELACVLIAYCVSIEEEWRERERNSRDTMENSFFFSNLLENFDIFEKQSQRDGKKKRREEHREERERETDQEKEIAFHLWAHSTNACNRIQGPRSPSGSPMWVIGSVVPDHHLLPPKTPYQERMKVEQPKIQLAFLYEMRYPKCWLNLLRIVRDLKSYSIKQNRS